MELEFNIIKSEEDDEEAQQKDPFDVHYERLHCVMDVVPRDSEEFQLIEKFAKNTQAPTEDFTIQFVGVLRLERQGEAEQFNRFILNRHLLWHGSRRSNFAGILNQGLRIAPPEAPVSGYMFGKAIYFADCVSKSAYYCHAQNADSFLLLCEVALGEMQEEKDAKNIEKPRLGYQSVKGLGEVFPNPDQSVTMSDGVIVPCGNLVKSRQTDLSLFYNEYMVYDVSQVRMRYLVRVKISS
ncbi:poly(ADP-ribose) polymerase [Aphelenchoides avenae]|nr:poly(ADP-ribose) polymerase [Aphelenchus avenae]